MTYSKDWCKGFCRTCGTGCAQHSELQYELQKQLDMTIAALSEARRQVAELTLEHDKKSKPIADES